MKLNNRGWGTTEMILLSGGLLIALLVAIFFISQLYGNLGLATENKIYVDLESKIEMAAKNYITDNDIEVTGQYKLTLKTLKNHNYISTFEDKSGNNCNGYVTITNIDSVNHYKGYILCNDYQTQNY